MPHPSASRRVVKAPRIAIFLPSLEPGGVQRMFVALARAFAEEHGLAVDLVLSDARGPHLAEVPDTVRVVDLKCRRQLAAVRPLARYLAAEKPNALLTGMPHSNVVALWARKWARATTTAVVISEHNPIYRTLESGQGMSWRVIRPLIRRYYNRADAIIAVSGESAQQLSEFAGVPRERITVIHNPVLTPECVERMGDELEHPWFAAGEPPVVLSVGRLVDQKDFPTLIRAFERVRAARPARLMILGEGPRRAQLEALRDSLDLGQDVALPGHVNNPFPYFARAAVFVLPSAFEGFGNALVEAMGAGTPVIATRCGGPAEILDGGKYGRLVKIGADEEMAQAIEDALDHPPRQAFLKQRAAEFSVAWIAPRYLKCMGMDATFVTGAPSLVGDPQNVPLSQT